MRVGTGPKVANDQRMQGATLGAKSKFAKERVTDRVSAMLFRELTVAGRAQLELVSGQKTVQTRRND